MSTIQNTVEQQLKAVSITGRMAYSITCLEIIIQHDNLDQQAFQPLLTALWDFTDNPDLGNWDENIMPFIPEDRTGWPIGGTPAISLFYQTLPPALLTCIDEIIDVGRGNLYAGVQSHSPATLTSVMWVVQYMLAHGYPLPQTEIFQRSPFTLQDQHGWGNRVARSFFQ
ncbi:MAG TPA: hypothetical protein VFO93_11000 [Hymenobacter sp.]|nr:hypothetical protein [Hymenobacter sp.]